MEPLNKKSKSTNCGEGFSSNCVIYQGNPIPCIAMCSTDTVSDIEYKLGQLMCNVKSSISVTDLDLTCIYTGCPGCSPPSDIKSVLQIMIDYMCKLKEATLYLNDQIASLGGDPFLLTDIPL